MKRENLSTEEILELIDKMITEWESVKTWEGICKRDALKELKFEIENKFRTSNLCSRNVTVIYH